MDKSVVQISGNRNLCQISPAFTTTFHFVLRTVLVYNQSMSTKKQISSLCKLYSIYEDIPEKFSVETDVDSYFYHNILDISQSHHRKVPVSKRSNEKNFAFKVFQFCDSKFYSNDLFSRKKSAFPKRKLSPYSKVWVIFSKLLIKLTNCRSFHYPNLKLRLDLQKQKTNCSVIVTRT